MKIKHLINRSEQLTSLSTYDYIESFAHLVEEVGEIGVCVSAKHTGRKAQAIKEDITVECVDVINCALELFFKCGGTQESLRKSMEEKMNKWEANLLKYDFISNNA